MGISRKQALECLGSDDLIGIGMEADAVRRRLHPEGVVSYALEGEIDCAGLAGSQSAAEGERVHARIAESLELGAGSVRLGNLTADGMNLGRIEQVISGIKARFSQLWLEALDAAAVRALAESSGCALEDAIRRLQAAGLDSVAGGGATISERADWIAVHRAAHRQGMQTNATILFGAGETPEESVDLLDAIRDVQQESGGFASFLPISAQVHGGSSRGRPVEEATGVEYLKLLAVSRIYLENIPSVQASGSTAGLKVLQMGLRFGADDAGCLPVHDRSSMGASTQTEEALRRVIRDAGFRPVQRDSMHRTEFLD